MFGISRIPCLPMPVAKAMRRHPAIIVRPARLPFVAATIQPFPLEYMHRIVRKPVLPEAYQGSRKLFLHGSTAADLANIRDNGVSGRLYVAQIEGCPLETKEDLAIFEMAKGYAIYASNQTHVPAIGVFALYGDVDLSSCVFFDDRRNTHYVEACHESQVFRLVMALTPDNKPMVLPEKGQRTRREGASVLRMSLTWYGALFGIVSAVDFFVNN